ncbi:MAG: hypothetical protein IJ638_01390 [Alphaproteobacteria bacterium]|nr:hypothetical protein [Alphaproteobacteria bacterium]
MKMNLNAKNIDLSGDMSSLMEIKGYVSRKSNKKGSQLRAQKRELGLAREELARLKSEECPYYSQNVMGGPAFQWELDHQERIANCQKNISDIKARIKELTQKQR